MGRHVQLRLGCPLAIPSSRLPSQLGSTGGLGLLWGSCSMTQGIHLQFPSAGRPGLSSSGLYLAPVLGQEPVGRLSGGGC
ncbi:hypothetical protein ACER0C_018795 [Sarotherodon galilaeus]